MLNILLIKHCQFIIDATINSKYKYLIKYSDTTNINVIVIMSTIYMVAGTKP